MNTPPTLIKDYSWGFFLHAREGVTEKGGVRTGPQDFCVAYPQ
ncbi:hypothetical protein CWATWH0003_4340 [Crocosphaera watsonii WH 0003]|uniref:Uncharacterized protein n=1 Tax=Crocosphaera watsonii WH 0003 TaxID=423471 RepID=G5JA76_CROWT|nr:hypothetical protein CWATWH0003_4340 [Crocosphaera watsonii WH 0003]